MNILTKLWDFFVEWSEVINRFREQTNNRGWYF